MRLDPETIYHHLKNAKFNEEVALEIQECVRIKNELDDFKKENGI